jgi:hypothetical protein
LMSTADARLLPCHAHCSGKTSEQLQCGAPTSQASFTPNPHFADLEEFRRGRFRNREYQKGLSVLEMLAPLMLPLFGMLEPLLWFAWIVLVTLIVSALLCRYRVTRQKQPSWGTVVASSIIGNLFALAAGLFYDAGWEVFSRDTLTEPKGGWGLILIVLGVLTIFCILPALAVAGYYQHRTKRAQPAAP